MLCELIDCLRATCSFHACAHEVVPLRVGIVASEPAGKPLSTPIAWRRAPLPRWKSRGCWPIQMRGLHPARFCSGRNHIQPPNIFGGLSIRPHDESWRWDLAPAPEWSREWHRAHEVGAWIDGASYPRDAPFRGKVVVVHRLSLERRLAR